jgi:serine/threonine protein kinase
MAGGLSQIHDYKTKSGSLDHHRIYGRHGDIKPDNILVFLDPVDPQSRGTLVITDFGLTRFHSDHTKTYFKRNIPMTPTYRPPECDMHGGSVSRSFDIWSYGCVLLEFIAWYLGGLELLDNFVQRRKTPDPQLSGIKSDQFFEIVRSRSTENGDVTLSARVKVEVLEVG